MDLFPLEANWSFLVAALALLEVAAMVLLVYVARLRHRSRRTADSPNTAVALPRFDAKKVSREIQRLRSGGDLDRETMKRMTPEDRALFEVSIIDALNKSTREDQHRLRSALIKYGYDEQCARRVMSEDLSDRVRACALLSLLRPQWRHPSIEPEQLRRMRATLWLALPRGLLVRWTGNNLPQKLISISSKFETAGLGFQVGSFFW